MEKIFPQIIDEEAKRHGGWFQSSNNIIDQWIRIIGPIGFTIWSTMKRFCSGNGEGVFPKVSQNDWAEYIGITKESFISSLFDLESAGLIQIRRPEGREKLFGYPSVYILKDISNVNPMEAIDKINQQRENRHKNRSTEKAQKRTKKNLIVKRLSDSSRFIDKIYSNDSGIFKTVDDKELPTTDEPENRTALKEQYNNNTVNKNKIINNFKEKSEDFPNNNSNQPSIGNETINFNRGIAETLPIHSNESIPITEKEIGFITSRKDKLAQRQLKESKENFKTKKPPKLYMQKGWQKILIEEWNNLPMVHKHKRMTTKQMKEVEQILKTMLKGTFFDSRHLDEKFIEQNNVDVNTKFSERQIINTVKKYQFYLTPGYWPEDKSSLPKNLSTFLYNPNTGKSLFLCAFFKDDVHPLSQKQKKIDPYQTYTDQFQWLTKNIDDKDELQKVPYWISTLVKWANQTFDFSTNMAKWNVGDNTAKDGLLPFFKYYSNWLKYDTEWSEDYMAENPKFVFNTWGKVWKDFVEHYHHVVIFRENGE